MLHTDVIYERGLSTDADVIVAEDLSKPHVVAINFQTKYGGDATIWWLHGYSGYSGYMLQWLTN